MTGPFKEYNSPGVSRYSARIREETWARHRQKLTVFHELNMPRKEMLEIMKREDDFSPSPAQLNSRFKIWGLKCYEKSTPRATSRPTPRSTPRPISRSTPASQDQSCNHTQPYTFPSANLMEPLQFDLEGVGGGFEDVEYVDADHAAAYHPWLHVHLDDSGPSWRELGEISRQAHDQIVGTSGYPGREDLPQQLSDEETSSSSGVAILTPGTSTPGQAASSFISNQPARMPASSCETGHGLGRAVLASQLNLAGLSQALTQTARPTVPSPCTIPQTPTDLKVTEELFRCVKDFSFLVLSDRQKPASGTQLRDDVRRNQIRACINSTAQAYEKAHYFLKLGDSEKATESLQVAPAMMTPMFADPDLFLLTRLVEIATWSSWKKFPKYEPIVFSCLSRMSAEMLGPRHPVTLLLGCFSQAAPISTSYPRLWSCIIDHIDRIADGSDPASRSEAQQIRIKAYFYLVRVLRNNAEHVEAIRRCGELIQLCIAIDGTRSFSANRARYNLGVSHCEAGDMESAMLAYQEARQYLGSKDFPHEGWIFAVFASSELAQLHEQKGETDEAANLYEEALLAFLECGGDESSGALLMLKDLIEFHERLDNQDQLSRIKTQYPACCTSLKMGVLDQAQCWVGRRVTTQASGGKRRRAWTWTSPLT